MLSWGFGFLWMSTPPVLAKSNGNCSEYKPECIEDKQKQLFYAGLALTAMGMASQSACYTLFVAEQADDEDEGGCNCTLLHCYCCGFKCRNSFVGLAALLVVAFVKPWAILFGIGAIFGVISLLIFLIRICQYNYVGPQGSILTTIFRVLFAASSKTFYRRPQNLNELYEKHNVHADALLAHTKGLRCLDKAAIVLPQPALQQEERNRWRLCTVTEVEETKSFIRTIPIWTTLILCGVVSSLGATYFLEQANHLNPKVGRSKIPLILLLWLYIQFRNIICLFFGGIFNLFGCCSIPSARYLPRVGFAVSMVFAVLCCITAAKVETRRLDVVEAHGLVDQPDEKIPMNIFWLLPQFALLGGCDGIYLLGYTHFSIDQAPLSMIKYFNFFANAFFGLGFMGSPVLVAIVGSISKKSGTNWFQSTLNESCLDSYYWALASLSAANLLLYIVFAVFYHYRDSRIDYLQVEITLDDCNF